MTDYTDIPRGSLSAIEADAPWSSYREPAELTEMEMRDKIEEAIEEMDAGDIKKLYDHLMLEGWIELE